MPTSSVTINLKLTRDHAVLELAGYLELRLVKKIRLESAHQLRSAVTATKRDAATVGPQ